MECEEFDKVVYAIRSGPAVATGGASWVDAADRVGVGEPLVGCHKRRVVFELVAERGTRVFFAGDLAVVKASATDRTRDQPEVRLSADLLGEFIVVELVVAGLPRVGCKRLGVPADLAGFGRHPLLSAVENLEQVDLVRTGSKPRARCWRRQEISRGRDIDKTRQVDRTHRHEEAVVRITKYRDRTLRIAEVDKLNPP